MCCSDGSTINSLVLNLTPFPQDALHGDQSDQSVVFKRNTNLYPEHRNEERRSTYLARRIGLLLRVQRTGWSIAYNFLNDRHQRTPFSTHDIDELSRSQTHPDSAARRALGPFAPIGGLAESIVHWEYIAEVGLLFPSKNLYTYSSSVLRDSIRFPVLISLRDRVFRTI